MSRPFTRHSAAGSPEECPDVFFYGVRGAFEPYAENHVGMGPTVSSVAHRTVALLDAHASTKRLAQIGIRYPANTWVYFLSRALGGWSLCRQLEGDSQLCPEARVVMVGLSQGAEVVRRALAVVDASVLPRIAAVVLLGDPTRRSDDCWQHGTADSSSGIAAWVAKSIPPALHERVWGYTLEGDEIAANHVGLKGIFRSGTHTLYEHNHEGVLDRAAMFIVEQLECLDGLDPAPPSTESPNEHTDAK